MVNHQLSTPPAPARTDHAAMTEEVTTMNADTTTTAAQHDDADAALRAIMSRKITGTEWGRELIRAATIECVYAPWFRDITYTGRDNDRDGLSLCIEDPRTGMWTRYHATHADIADAIAAIWNGQHGNGYIREYIADAINEHDAGHIDADAADAIIQVATLGDIVYG
jgi:hypothetical protein